MWKWFISQRRSTAAPPSPWNVLVWQIPHVSFSLRDLDGDGSNPTVFVDCQPSSVQPSSNDVIKRHNVHILNRNHLGCQSGLVSSCGRFCHHDDLKTGQGQMSNSSYHRGHQPFWSLRASAWLLSHAAFLIPRVISAFCDILWWIILI